MEHALLGFLDRLKLITLEIAGLSVVATAAILIVRNLLIGQFRQMDVAGRITYLIFGSMVAMFLIGFTLVTPLMLGYRSKPVKISEVIIIVLVDIILWLLLHHRFKLLSSEDQKEWKAIIPPHKWTRANWIMMGLYCIPLILYLCGVHARWTVFELPVLFLIQAGMIAFKFRPWGWKCRWLMVTQGRLLRGVALLTTAEKQTERWNMHSSDF